MFILQSFLKQSKKKEPLNFFERCTARFQIGCVSDDESKTSKIKSIWCGGVKIRVKEQRKRLGGRRGMRAIA